MATGMLIGPGGRKIGSGGAMIGDPAQPCGTCGCGSGSVSGCSCPGVTSIDFTFAGFDGGGTCTSGGIFISNDGYIDGTLDGLSGTALPTRTCHLGVTGITTGILLEEFAGGSGCTGSHTTEAMTLDIDFDFEVAGYLSWVATLKDGSGTIHIQIGAGEGGTTGDSTVSVGDCSTHSYSFAITLISADIGPGTLFVTLNF